MKAAKEYIEREGVDCDFVLTRALDVHFSSAQDTRIKERLRRFEAAGVAAAQEVSEVAKDHAEIVRVSSAFPANNDL